MQVNSTLPPWAALRFTMIQAEYRADADCALPHYKGSMLRGALGHALKHLACLRDHRDCSSCQAPAACAYAQLFEPHLVDPNKRLLPIILATPTSAAGNVAAGVHMRLGLTIVGDARAWLPWLCWALARMGRCGLGSERSRWTLTNLSAYGPDGQPISLSASIERCPEFTGAELARAIPVSSAVRVDFVTPTRLQKSTAAEANGELLLRKLMRRIGGLAEAYCGWSAREFEFRPLVEAACNIVCSERSLRVHHWEHFSTRKQSKHPLAGLMGHIVLEGAAPELLPWLYVGQWTHVGESSSFGMGQFAVTPLED